MTGAQNRAPHEAPDPAATLAIFLKDDDAIVRCAATHAIGRFGSRSAAPALLDALHDEDPDVRTDAMSALVRCARPQDGDIIRRSLMGDPVKEVKILAVDALCELGDLASVPLLRALARDRCVHDVAWEDEAGMWDDWLDVQIAAVRALGKMSAEDAVADLLEARSDEMGQDLDDIVFAALARIPHAGIAAMLDFVGDSETRLRERAIGALSKARHDVIVPMCDVLLHDDSPNVRRLAIPCLDPHCAPAASLALDDADVGVRRAALAAFAPSCPDIARAALADADEEARAIALEAVVAGSQPIDDDLAGNVLAWMIVSDGRLAATCAAALPTLCGAGAVEPLCDLAADSERPLEARTAALRSLAWTGSDQAIMTLQKSAVDPVRQIRMVALASLADIARSDLDPAREQATTILVEAMRGKIAGTEPAMQSEFADDQQSLGASKVEAATGRNIVITPEGDIVEGEDVLELDIVGEAAETRFPSSTLDAIQAPPDLLGAAGDAHLSEIDVDRLSAIRSGRRRRRVAVDGPDDVGTDVRVLALQTAADCPAQAVEMALAECTDTGMPEIRLAAFEAIARRSARMSLSSGLKMTLVQALKDPDADIRGYAARAVAASVADAADHLIAHLDDPDAIVRAHALDVVAARTPDRAVVGFLDDSALVRQSALDSILEHANPDQMEAAVGVCLEAGRIDSLSEASSRSTAVVDLLVSMLADNGMTRQHTRCALQALGDGKTSATTGAAG